MRLYRHSANSSGDIINLFFTVSEDDQQATLIAKRVLPLGKHLVEDTGYAAFAADGPNVVKSLSSLNWKRASDVPPSLRTHAALPYPSTKAHWQVADNIPPDFLDILSGKAARPAAPAKASGINLGTVIIAAVVTAAILVFLIDWF